MTGSYANSFENGRQGRIFLLVAVLHAAVLYGVLLQKRTLHRPGTEAHIDLIWIKSPALKAAAPTPAPSVRSKPTVMPKANPAPAVPTQEAKRQDPDAPTPAEGAAAKPLDLQKILAEVGPEIRKLDGEQPAGHALKTEPGQASFETKLGQVLANSVAPPKFYEPPRIEDISSGAQLDGGIRMYKIITFAGTYCVAYHDGAQSYIGVCPIKF